MPGKWTDCCCCCRPGPPHIRAPDSWLQQIARPNNINKYGPGSFSFFFRPLEIINTHTRHLSKVTGQKGLAGWRSSICLTHSTLLLLLLYGWPSLTLRIYFHWQVFSSRVQRGERGRGRNGREEKGAPKFLFFFLKKEIFFFFFPNFISVVCSSECGRGRTPEAVFYFKFKFKKIEKKKNEFEWKTSSHFLKTAKTTR